MAVIESYSPANRRFFLVQSRSPVSTSPWDRLRSFILDLFDLDLDGDADYDDFESMFTGLVNTRRIDDARNIYY